jgi:hypothetical protein
VGTVPVFIVAGFLESFVTRYTNMPLWLSLVIILGSLSAVIGYFIVYPIYLYGKTIKHQTLNNKTPNIKQ